jgi:hypothetical protein
MNILKIILIGILVVFLVFSGMWLIGVALSLLKFLFWLFVIGLVGLGLWKMFGPKGAKQEQVEEAEPDSKLQNTELTLDEYKRKLEAQLKQSSEK